MTKLTVGMAVFDDMAGVAFTCQSLRMHHPAVTEIIVVDNNPASEQGQRTRGYCGTRADTRYIAAGEIVGTSAPRDRVFREATGDIVFCCDPHMLFMPGAFGRLIEYADANPESNDLWQGPLLDEALNVFATHFKPGWCDAMWGTWDCDPRALDPATDPAKRVPCMDAPPFEIQMMGLGLFACRKSAWLGFNPAFRLFGGEEGYIHEKYKQAGRKTLCLPFLQGWHWFGRSGQPYPNSIWHRVRNYVIGWRELGLPIDSIREHFVDGACTDGCFRPAIVDGKTAQVNDLDPHKRISAIQWEAIIGGAEGPVNDPAIRTVTTVTKTVEVTRTVTGGNVAGESCGGCPAELANLTSLGDWCIHAAITPSDINEHVPKLQELSSQCEHVTEFGMRHGVSTVALLTGQPKRFVSYDLNRSAEVDVLAKFAGKTEFSFVAGNSLQVDIEQTDLLFIDTLHTADQLYGELRRHSGKVRRWIVLHDTETFGEHGEGGGPGLLPALRRFLQESPRWSVLSHAANNNGLTVVGCDPRDKPKLPGLITLAGNFAAAVAAHVADGMTTVTPEQMQARLEICATCELRNGDNCSKCGCNLIHGVPPLPGKTAVRTAFCPIGKWHAITPESAP